jgi:tetratricopeptide (TPR) repeat protein
MSRYFPLIIFVFSIWSCKPKNEAKEKRSEAIGCNTPATDLDWYTSGKKAPRIPGLEGIDFKITTVNKEAQDYFNQGMMLAYGFNHAEAARSFFEATRLDSGCAMGYWGFAYVLGPNYNAGMEPDNFKRAYEASQKAILLSASCTPLEKDLIKALSVRYIKEAPQDRKALDLAYYEEMKKLHEKYPDNADVASIYAESLMDLHPWDLYEKSTKKPKAWTPELVAVVENILSKFPNHPGGHHYYIHALEASSNPEKAMASADKLMAMVPGSGHLVHMPSHIYINTGDYHRGSLSNLKAVKVDSGYLTACHAQGAYPLAYYPHNYHFLAATATLEGNSKWAWMASRKVQEKTAKDLLNQPGWGTLQHYFSIPYYVAVKLGMWDTILAEPFPNPELIYPRAILHYARGMAFVGKNDLSSAAKELASLKVLSKDSTLSAVTIWGINTTIDLVKISVSVLEGSMAATTKDYEKAMSLLSRAIAIEDNLNYNEPPDWFFSVRQQLGAVQLKAGKYAEAEKTYRDDLQRYKKNGYSLLGLSMALEKQEKKEEYSLVKKQFDEAWKYADFRINSSSSL